MNHFPAEPKLEPYEDGETWFLLEDFVYQRDSGDVLVPKGMETDFASVPALFTNAIPKWGKYGRAAIVHDWLYWAQFTTRLEADNILAEAMGVLGVADWQESTIYWAVREFGWIAWKDNARLMNEGYSRMHNDGATNKCWQRKRISAAIGLTT